MFESYIKKIDRKNRKVTNDFLNYSGTEHEFWQNIEDIGFIEKYFYDFALFVVNTKRTLKQKYNAVIEMIKID